MVKANVVKNIVSESPLLYHKDVAQISYQKSMYELSEVQFAQDGQIDMLLGINAFSSFPDVIDQLSETCTIIKSILL